MQDLSRFVLEPLDPTDAGLMGGWMRIPMDWLTTDLTPQEHRVLMHMLWRTATSRNAQNFYYESDMSAASGLGHSRQFLSRTLAKLERAGYIEHVGYRPVLHANGGGRSVKRWRVLAPKGKYVVIPRWLLMPRSPIPGVRHLSDNALRLVIQYKAWGNFDPRTNMLTPFARSNRQLGQACNLSPRAVVYAKREIEEYFGC